MYLTPIRKPGFTAGISSFLRRMGVASHFRSSSSERLRHAAQSSSSNVNFETDRVTNQIRGLVCHDRSQGRILPHIHPSVSQRVPEVGPGSTTSHCPTVAGQSMIPRSISLLDRPHPELPARRDLLSQAGGSIFHPLPEL